MLAAVSAVRSQPSKTIVKFRVVCKDGSTPSMRTVLMPLDEVNEAALMDAFNLNENQHIITEASFMGQRSDNLMIISKMYLSMPMQSPDRKSLH